jgi:hypothetical protein
MVAEGGGDEDLWRKVEEMGGKGELWRDGWSYKDEIW